MFNINLEEAELEFKSNEEVTKEGILDYTKDLNVFEALDSVQTILDIMVCKGASDTIMEGSLLLESKLLNTIVNEKKEDVQDGHVSMNPTEREHGKGLVGKLWMRFVIFLKGLMRSVKRKLGMKDKKLKQILSNLEKQSNWRNPPENITKTVDFLRIVINAGSEYQRDVLDQYNDTWDKFYELQKDLSQEQFNRLHPLLGPVNKEMELADKSYDELYKLLQACSKDDKLMSSTEFFDKMKKAKETYDMATERTRTALRALVKEMQDI